MKKILLILIVLNLFFLNIPNQEINTAYAHRGLSSKKGMFIENSSSAIKDSLNKKYGIEIDVRLSKDDEIIVFHDFFVNRLTNKKGFVRNFTLKELEKMSLLETQDKILSFDKALSIVDGKQPLLIDLKGDVFSHKLEKKLIKKLKEYEGEYSFVSFNPINLHYLSQNKVNEGIYLGLNTKAIPLIEDISQNFVASTVALFVDYDFVNYNKNISRDNDEIKHLTWSLDYSLVEQKKGGK